MTSINKTTLLGRVGQDPEVRYLPSGDAVMNLSVATSHRFLARKTEEQGFVKKTEEWKEVTEWHKVVIFGSRALMLKDLITKGSEVFVEGMLRTRKWKDANGNDKQTTEIKADICKVCVKETAVSESTPQQLPAHIQTGLDDIPF